MDIHRLGPEIHLPIQIFGLNSLEPPTPTLNLIILLRYVRPSGMCDTLVCAAAWYVRQPDMCDKMSRDKLGHERHVTSNATLSRARAFAAVRASFQS